MVAPALQSEGKALQREQSVGMGATSAAAPAPGADGVLSPSPEDVPDPTVAVGDPAALAR
jgi:hypothetical protein